MHRFKITFFFLLALVNESSQAQNMQATYAIEKNVNINTTSGSKTISLNLTGHYYKENNRYIYWQSPDYLLKYPTGIISFSTDNSSNTYSLNTDTVQTLFYHDYDSLIVRQGLYSQYQRIITEYQFEAGRSQPWKYEKETKVINGLKCQLATDRDQWRVWFCADFPVKTSLRSLQGLPGLVVEADCLPTDEHFILLSYDVHPTIRESVFKPDLLKQPMAKGGMLKSIKPNPEKTKLEKQQELLKQ